MYIYIYTNPSANCSDPGQLATPLTYKYIYKRAKYYLDQKVSGIYSESQKYKYNTSFWILSPFKILLIDSYTLMPELDPILETFFYARFSVWLSEPFSIFTILKMKSSLHQRVCIKFWVKNGFNGVKMLNKCYSIKNKHLWVAQVFVSLSRMTKAVDIENRRKRQ